MNLDNSRDHLGVMFSAGKARGTVTHFNGATGRDKFDAYALGGYWTHFGQGGWYVDSVLQGTRYSAETTANRGLRPFRTRGNGISASAEGGKPYRFDSGYFIEPQAQLIYQTINLKDGNDNGARVTFSGVKSLVGRIGARFGRTWSMDDDASNERQMSVWVRPNIWREFQGDSTTRFSSADGAIPFQSSLGGSWGETSVGISGQFSRNTTVFASGSYQTRLDGGGHAYNAKVGLRINW
jgi:outer membrane autotransporter protein